MRLLNVKDLRQSGGWERYLSRPWMAKVDRKMRVIQIYVHHNRATSVVPCKVLEPWTYKEFYEALKRKRLTAFRGMEKISFKEDHRKMRVIQIILHHRRAGSAVPCKVLEPWTYIGKIKGLSGAHGMVIYSTISEIPRSICREWYTDTTATRSLLQRPSASSDQHTWETRGKL